MAPDTTSARKAVLQILFRAIRSYTATSALASLSSVAPEDLVPFFRSRSQPVIDIFRRAYPEDSTLPEDLRSWYEHVHPGTVSQTQNSIAAACLVFSHSLADSAVAELCCIAAEFDQAYWAKTKTVSSRSVTLETVIKRGVDKLVRTTIREKIGHMSLPKKMNHLLQNASTHSVVHYPGFSYDNHRLAELDQFRHAVIHGEGITLQISARDSQEVFFTLTVYAGLVVSSMLGLEIRYPDLFVDWMNDMAASLSDGKPLEKENDLS